MQKSTVEGTVASGILSAARIETGLSLRDLSKLVSLSPSTLCAYENCYTEPSIPVMMRILEALGFELVIGFKPIDSTAVAQQKLEDNIEGIEDWRKEVLATAYRNA